MAKVIKRYKNKTVLKSYQLENEFFLKVFGECKDFDRSRLVDEFKLVKGGFLESEPFPRLDSLFVPAEPLSVSVSCILY